jgi:hypothetical protein
MKWGLAAVFLTAIVAVIFLSQMGSMTRFEHRTLRCLNPLIGPFEIVLGKPAVGRSLQLSQPTGDRQIAISKIDSDTITAGFEDMVFLINVDAVQVRVLRGTQISSSRCEKTEFSM